MKTSKLTSAIITLIALLAIDVETKELGPTKTPSSHSTSALANGRGGCPLPANTACRFTTCR